ncbi:MAG TPA: tetratricopeptide repeat protein [Pirellulales bacterium]
MNESNAASPFKFKHAARVTLIAILALWAYLPSLSGDYLLDDDILLTNNQLVHAPDGLYRMWFTTEPTDYWPLTSTTFWLEQRVWGQNPTGYHAVNLLLHIAACLLLWQILNRLAIPGGFWAALLFAIHPVNVESVAWIAQRKNVLAMLFYLLSILWYLRADEQSRTWNRWYWLSLVAFLLAMLSKGSVAVLPLELLLLIGWKRRLTKADGIKTAPFFLLAAVLTLVNIWFQTHGAANPTREAGLVDRILGAAAIVWFYLLKSLLPIRLSFVYPQWHVTAADWRWWLPLIGAIVVTFLLCQKHMRTWGRSLLFGWSYYCIALLPVMGFTAVGFMKYSLVADHYQHIALLGIVSLLAAGWEFGLAHIRLPLRNAWSLLAPAVIIAFAFQCHRQSQIYRSPIELYEATLRLNPESWLAEYNLALALAQTGALDDAVDHYRKAAALKPDSKEIQNNFGQTLVESGHPAAAIEHFDTALKIDSKFTQAYVGKANALLLLKQAAAAIDCYHAALAIAPEDAQIISQLALALLADGKSAEALSTAEHAIKLSPDAAEVHNNLALIEDRLGRLQEAIDQYRAALKLKPDYELAHKNLGIALFNSGNAAEAIDHLEQYLKSSPNDLGVWAILVIDYDQTGQQPKAIAAARHVIQLARARQQTELAEQLEAWLATKGEK